VVSNESEIIAMSQQSQVIRTAIDSVSTLGRATQGVRVMKLRAGDSVASFTLI
jgi:DNA gyrase subunit A